MSDKLDIISFVQDKDSILCEIGCNDYLDEKFKKRREELRKENSKLFFKGFRKGKEPLDVFIKGVGQELFFYPLVFEILDNRRQKEALLIFDVKKIDVKLFPKEKLVCKFALERYPDLDAGDKYKGIKLTKLPEDITDENYEAEINRLVMNKRKIKNESKEIVEKGDYVTFACKNNDNEIKLEIDNDYSVIVGNHQWPQSFEDALIGHKINEDLIMPTEFPEGYIASELSNRKVTFAVKIKDIRGIEAPEVDDFFAKLHGYPDVDAMKKSVLERLKENKIESNKEKYFDELEIILLDIYGINEIEIPEEYVMRKILDKLKGYDSMFKQQKKSFQTWMKENPEQYESLVGEGMKERVRKGTKIHIILENIANEEGITVSDEELKEAGLKWPYMAETAESLVTFLRRRKVVDKIMEYAIFE